MSATRAYNEPMSTRSAEYLEALDHLPVGAALVFQQVSWKEYEELLRDLDDRPGLRVSYDEGKLEIMSPHPEHEEYKDFIFRMVCAFAEEHGMELIVFPHHSPFLPPRHLLFPLSFLSLTSLKMATANFCTCL